MVFHRMCLHIGNVFSWYYVQDIFRNDEFEINSFYQQNVIECGFQYQMF